MLSASRAPASQSARTLVVTLSAFLFLIALPLPALEFHGVNGAFVNGNTALQNTPGFDQTLDLWSGVHAVLNGFFGILDNDLEGYATPCLWIAWVMLLIGRIRGAAAWAAAAALLSLLTFNLFHSPIPEDEGVVKRALLTHMHAGVWFWFASIFLMLVASVFWWIKLPPNRTPVYNPYAPVSPPPNPFSAAPPPPPSAAIPPPPPPNL